MDESPDTKEDVDDGEQWKLHKSVFDNDSLTLTEILKSNINLIDKKVKKFSLIICVTVLFLT